MASVTLRPGLLFARLARGAIAFVLVVLAVRVARADEPTSTPQSHSTDDRTLAEARQHFERGYQLAKDRRSLDAALAEFLASRDLHPMRTSTCNAAVILDLLGRYAEALELYSATLREFSFPADGGSGAFCDRRPGIEQRIAALRALTGEIEIQCGDPGASVSVDGEQRGMTPLPDAFRVNAGTHTVRLAKEGFATEELTISIAGGARKTVKLTLHRLFATGTLVVQELSGRSLDVVVDAVAVGRTPWRGSLALGSHSVILRGAGYFGTSPSSAEVRQNEVTTLTLSATELDSSLRVEPTPSSAAVHFDGISVGSGIWDGRLPSGPHRVEIVAAGHLPFRRDVNLTKGGRQVVRGILERDPSSPLWRYAARPHLYAELEVAAALAHTFNGGADNSCQCRDRQPPLGALGGARVGYMLPNRIAVELLGGYLSLSERMTRRITGLGDANSPTFSSTDYLDQTTLSGPLAELSGSYRLLDKRTPLTARIGMGVAVLTSSTSNGGTFAGSVTNPDTGQASTASRAVSIPEAQQHLVTPFGSTELRFGYRFSKLVSADIGVALLVLVPPDAPRAGTSNLGGDAHRATLLDPSGVPGVMRLPDERVAGPFLAIAPSIAVRADL